MSLASATCGRQPGKVRAEIAWCLLGLAVFLMLPSLGYHHYGPFYRPVEVRQSAGRHSFLAAPASESEPRFDANRREPVARAAAVNPVVVQALRTDLPPPIRIVRCLMRLRVSIAAGDGSDPDILA